MSVSDAENGPVPEMPFIEARVALLTQLAQPEEDVALQSVALRLQILKGQQTNTRKVRVAVGIVRAPLNVLRPVSCVGKV